MAVDRKKLAALAEEKGKKGPPQKKPGKGGPPPPKAHEEDEEHEPDEETDPGKEHEENDEENDGKLAEQEAKRVADGDGDEKLMELSSGVDEENDPPEWVKDEDVWERAKKAVDALKEEPDDYYAVVTHVYESMGGEIGGGEGGE